MYLRRQEKKERRGDERRKDGKRCEPTVEGEVILEKRRRDERQEDKRQEETGTDEK